MCGITGYWCPGTRPAEATLRSMMASLVHRGPDGDGVFVDEANDVAMGHVRLAIIDLEGGEQPLFAGPERNVVLTANGELYDYKLERTRLSCEGVRFQTKTDSEIALHLYRRHGLDFVHHLRGEFALAMFDRDAQRLVLVRDRFGIKPLYVRHSPQGVIWGSEIKALLAHPSVPARLCSQAALHQMMQVMAPGTTAFEGIEGVKPGEMLVVERDGAGLRSRAIRYWDADFPQAGDHASGAETEPFVDGVRERLIDAVRVRLEADVPVGCYLSGGIDSCSALGLATTMQQSHVRAFTISFDDAAYDEAKIAAEMAERTAASQVVLDLKREQLYGQAFERTAWHTERTFYNTLAVAKWHMSRRVHEDGYKVVITGEGSDELFAGYPFFKVDYLRHCVAPEERARQLDALAASNAVFKGSILSEASHSHPAFNDLVGFTPAWLQPWMSVLERVRPLLAKERREEVAEYDPIQGIADRLDSNQISGRHPLDRVQYSWIKTMLEGQILTWGGDRVDMANSMESRPPFLDHQLAEFAFQVPPSVRIRDGIEKWVLREAMRGVLPTTLYEREKFAFMAPPATIDAAKAAAVQALVERYLSPAAVETAGVFDATAVERFLAATQRETERDRAVQNDVILNHLLGLQVLHAQFVQGQAPPPN
ncbi:MAG: asparagine synthase (glutamine-hydrolyzing) [Myxococcales bacterium FL481]|nr:MAG: asparagine synthase (glutamine-hydrolyzing) [Myxococcales bacterium FL481]